jgi:uncharacterized protein with von Willebrand factor type A (vWA) domain
MFFRASEAQHHRIYDVFAFGSKITVFTRFFG